MITHRLSDELPPQGVKLIVKGGSLAGSFTPAPDGGVYARFCGVVNRHARFQGRTSDFGFVHLDEVGVTWQPVEPEYRTIDADQVPDGIRWHVPPRNQGQIVEVAFSTGNRYRRITDRADGRKEYAYLE